MPADRLRVLVPALLAVALLVASSLLLDWFVVERPGDTLALDLRDTSSTVASATFWIALAFAAIVALQAGARLFADQVSPRFTRAGYLMGVMLFGNAFIAGYLFGPDTVLYGLDDLAIIVERTWAPLMMLGGVAAGMVALYYAALEESLTTEIIDVSPSLPPARALPRTPEAPDAAESGSPRTRAPSSAGVLDAQSSWAGALGSQRTRPPSSADVLGSPRTRAPSSADVLGSPRTRPPSSSDAPARGSQPNLPRPSSSSERTAVSRTLTPHRLRGRLRFAALTAELTRGGIDARREDGSAVLVVWRDVVGAVVRRLPAELGEDATFIDIVSTAGSTLRLVPWTRLGGDAIEGEDRTLALLAYIVKRCPDITLDPATRAFIEGRAEAAQLPDVATLAAHDGRLA